MNVKRKGKHKRLRPHARKKNLAADTGDYFRWSYICADSRAESRHDEPVLRVFQNVWYKRPSLAHSWFDGMNRADFVFPENAVSVFGLSQNVFAAGKLTVFFQKQLRIEMNEGGYCLNILRGNVGSAESIAAVAALLTVENILWYRKITLHGGSPLLFSG